MIKWTSWVGVVHISLNLARSGCPSVFAWRRTLSLNALKKIQGSLSSIQGLTVRRVGCWNTCVQTSEAGRVFFRHFSKYEFDFWTERFKNQIFQWVESGSVSEVEGIGRGRCAIDIELWINCKIYMYTSRTCQEHDNVWEGKLGFVLSQYSLICLYSFGDEKKKPCDPS